MPFLFLKYLQPTHYFRLQTKTGQTVFPKLELLPTMIVNQLTPDINYQSTQAQKYDLSWQAVQMGYIGNTEVYMHFDELSARDNYQFIRKNFHQAWVFYVLLLRLISFHNPIVECCAWFQTRKFSRNKAFNKPIEYPEWHSYTSLLIAENPKISVIIPTLNRYDYLHDVLSDLEQQDYKHFEVIVVDQSDAFQADFYSKFKLDIHLIQQKEKALWLARNTAIKISKGSLIALSEDDVRIKPNWISSHLKCLDFFKAKVSAGVFYPQGKDIPQERSFFAIGSQFATGNAMIYKDVFKIVGLFDRQFEKQRMGDGEFGMRIYLADIISVSNPEASCIDVKAGIGGLREMGSWDSFRPSSFFAARPIPSVLYYFRRYFGDAASRFAMLRMIPISIFPYQFKKNKPLLVLGLLVTVLILPVVFYQVMKSWYLASKKMQQGPLIETL